MHRVLVLVASLALIVPAIASGADLEATPASPEPNKTYALASPAGYVLAEVRTPVPQRFNSLTSGLFVAELSTSAALGQDGTLADDLRASYTYLRRRDSDPAAWYGGLPNTGWASTPGTYYFQFSYQVHDSATSLPVADYPASCPGRVSDCVYASPVYATSFAAPQPLPISPQPTAPAPRRSYLSLAAASERAKVYTRRQWGARSPTAACRRVSSRQMLCRVAWLNKRGKKIRRALDVIKDPGNRYTVQPR